MRSRANNHLEISSSHHIITAMSLFEISRLDARQKCFLNTFKFLKVHVMQTEHKIDIFMRIKVKLLSKIILALDGHDLNFVLFAIQCMYIYICVVGVLFTSFSMRLQ